jgi:hypothetical protein
MYVDDSGSPSIKDNTNTNMYLYLSHIIQEHVISISIIETLYFMSREYS